MSAWGSGFTAPIFLGGFIAAAALMGFLLLWYESPAHGAWRARVQHWAARLRGRADLGWIDAWVLTAAAAAAFAVGGLVNWWTGAYNCAPNGPSDIITLWTSGQAFLHGGNPFSIAACGTTGNPVPAGLASVILDAVGSLGGPVGILVMWGAVSVAIVPFFWQLGGRDRAIVTGWVLVSFLYLPIVAVQVDGASLAIAPLAILVTLYLARSGWVRAAAVGGFLSTGRLPSLFPILGATGRAGGRRVAAFVAGAGTFAAITALCFAVYGTGFSGPVFFLQITRSNFALNYWGVLEGLGWVTPSITTAVIQAVLTVGLVFLAWFGARSPVGAVAIVLTGTILLAQFLSFDELILLLPIALVGTRARWWLWAIGLVATTNYLIAFESIASAGGSPIPTYALDLALTALLLGLFIDLLWTELRHAPAVAEPGIGPSAVRT